MTNYLFDLILIAIALITVIRCWKAGFAVSVLKFARLFICLIGAVLIGPAGHGILGFLVVFVVLFIAVTIVMSILKLITKIPIIHGIDKLLGLGLGSILYPEAPMRSHFTTIPYSLNLFTDLRARSKYSEGSDCDLIRFERIF